MSEKASPERRRYPRIELPKGICVAWQGGGQRFVTRVRNLSLGGVFVLTSQPPPVSTVVKLLFEVPNGEVRARGIVRRTQPGRGMGVKFLWMGHEDRARLHQLLKRLLR